MSNTQISSSLGFAAQAVLDTEHSQELAAKVIKGKILKPSELTSLGFNALGKLVELYHHTNQPALLVEKEELEVQEFSEQFLSDAAGRKAGERLLFSVDGAATECLSALARLRLVTNPRVSLALSSDDEKLVHLSFWYGANLVTNAELLESIKINSLFR